jgi:carboxypeptidase Taq
MNAYDRLTSRFARLSMLGEVKEILDWDGAVFMPDGGAAARGDHMAVVAATMHEALTDPAAAEDLKNVGTLDDPWEAANLEHMRDSLTRANALPADLVEAQARARTACEAIWREARARSDFGMVAESLSRVVDLARREANVLSDKLGLSPYDALMDDYQPGITSADLEPIFARYESFLADFLPKVLARQASSPDPIKLSGYYPADLQESYCRRLAGRAGLDFDHARLDRSTHPFCGGLPTDVRITTRYDESDPSVAVMGVIHETGHGLYEQGLPRKWARQPVGASAGMAAHESQSLILEMQACQSDPFLGWLSRDMALAFGGQSNEWDPANLIRLWRDVEPSFIRVEADEVTYPAHVILRFRLERALIAGDISVQDIPSAWNEGFRDLLGIVPPDDRQGCLQDIHWFESMFGYFPCYTLGAMAAAQMMNSARLAVPDMDHHLSEGDLAPLVGWLRTNVHALGSRYGFSDLLHASTGSPLDMSHFEAHLTARYLGEPSLTAKPGPSW